MTSTRPLTEHTDRSGFPRQLLPTMYDLPSEALEESGLPDEFHLLQPQLLSETFIPVSYDRDRIFTGSDLNLYYDLDRPQWYKRPDWFGVVGVPRLYDESDLRLSYVIWQEGVSPFVVVELLSPGTEREDLGKTQPQQDRPPTKWQVYEQVLQVPYYIAFDRYTDQLRAFRRSGEQFREVALSEARFWLDELGIGLGLWSGTYRQVNRLWLRWYDADGNWILSDLERAQRRAERLAAKLREMGVDPDEI
ncbi:Uma2 family endonuclease [Synechococcus sp. PCC 7336]|uniref:Uma2 family endonuclease n=1 Tax=Synechococcus sp. PCC 7336 TaxID=195250 RepID=UPI00037C66CF|nr:Uma2 family endonuclease [Synechococcus sp. PCC 7336]